MDQWIRIRLGISYLLYDLHLYLNIPFRVSCVDDGAPSILYSSVTPLSIKNWIDVKAAALAFIEIEVLLEEALVKYVLM